MDTFGIGMGLVKIGAGRMSLKDKVDPSSGIYLNVKIGDYIIRGEEIGVIFNSDEKKLDENLLSFQNYKNHTV